MYAQQHYVVWNNVSDRLKRIAEQAKVEGAAGAETAMLNLAVFAGVVAASYLDASTTFKA